MIHDMSEEVMSLYRLMGQEVNTEYGVGRLIGCSVDWNGLYVSYHTASWQVYYGMSLADEREGRVSASFTTSELCLFKS